MEDQRERHERSGDGHAKLHPGVWAITPLVRVMPPKAPGLDAQHLQAVAPHDERMANFVQDEQVE